MLKSLIQTSLIVATVTLMGCAAPPANKVKLSHVFDPKEAAQALLSGNNTIKGSALIKRMNGTIVTCAGNTVMLLPGTAYQAERMAAIYGNSESGYKSIWSNKRLVFEDQPADYATFSKKTVCDALGFFKFEGLADGQYYVYTDVYWKVEKYTTEGGSLFSAFNVKNGQTQEKTLAP